MTAQMFFTNPVGTHSTASHLFPCGGQLAEKGAMETPRRPGFPVARFRFSEHVGEVRDGVEPVLTALGKDAFHCVPFVPLWRTTHGERGDGNTKASEFSRRPSSVQRVRLGEVRDGVEPVLPRGEMLPDF